jgi:uncharacterized alpha-E superfamily protein
MPGALTRIAASSESVIVSNQAGGVSKDTWILATEPEKQVSLLTGVVREPAAHEARTALPGGAADNLFWLGRYAERSEQAIRIIKTALRIVRNDLDVDDVEGEGLAAILNAVTHVTGTHPGFVGPAGAADRAEPGPALLSLVLDGTRAGSVAFDLQAMLGAAYAVRDRLSGDTWRIVNDVRLRLARFHERKSAEPFGDVEDDLDALATDLVAIFGLAQESMTRGQAWLFLEVGRRLERALLLISLVRATLVAPADPRVEARILDGVLAAAESLTLYHRGFHERPRLDRVLGLLLLDPTNPRSLNFQLGRIQAAVGELSHEEGRLELAEEERLVLDAATSLRLADLAALAGDATGAEPRRELDAMLGHVATRLMRTSDVLTRAYFVDLRGPQHLASATHRAGS